MSMSDKSVVETAEKLRERARQNRSFEAAQIKIIGLDEIRHAAGASWPPLGDRIRTNSMRFIEGCLTDDDLVIPAGDGFVVIYLAAPDRDSVMQSAMLCEALNSFYLSSREMHSLSARVEVKCVDPRAMLNMLEGAKSLTDNGRQKHGLMFLPVWSVAQEAITGYWLAPMLGGYPDRRCGYSHAWQNSAAHDTSDFLSLDLEILQRAVAATQRSVASGQRCLVGYSVHATTMADHHSRQKYLASLYAVAEALRPYFVARIAEIEPGTPSATIAEWVHQIRPVSLRVSLELHESERAMVGLEGTGAFSASCTLPSSPMTTEARARYKGMINRWQPELRRQKLKFRLDNMHDAELTASAAASTVDFLSGDRFWPEVAHPEGVKAFSRSQFGNALRHVPSASR